MPVYTTQANTEAAGHAVGILLLDYKGPFVPGDVGNATSYDYPVLFRTVPKATSARVFAGDPELEAAVIAAAKALEAQGVKGISSDCGYFINYQDAVAKAVKVPVYLSSLLQLPFISACIGCKRPIGVICANATALGNRVLEMTGLGSEREVFIKGMRDEPIFGSSVTGDCVELDPEAIEAEVVGVAKRMLSERPELGAFLIECSMLPPYSKAVQDATGLPVFDFLTMIDFHEKAAHRRSYDG
ncbi:MAG: aspartate/glutamate racemase family protein [Acidobacteriota bacterium]